MTEAQLRIYTIKPGHLDDFLEAWRTGVLPLRGRFGFSIESWTVADEETFVWVMRYDGADTFEAADTAYYASPERRSLQPDPAQFVAAMDVRWLVPFAASADRSG